MARRSGAPGSSAPVTPAGPDSAIPGAGETLQWPLKQADGSDYVVPGGTNMPAGSAPTSAPTQSSPPLSVSANSELQALQAEMARRQAAPAASGAGPSGYAADSTGVTPPTPSMVQTLLNYAKKEGPPIAGGYIGGALGAPAGPLGIMGGAALGGAAGRALQRDYQYATGSRDPNSDTASGNAADIGVAGAVQGLSAGAGLAANAAVDAVAPSIGRVGARLLRMGSGAPVKSGEAALGVPLSANAPWKGLGFLGNAPSLAESGAAQDAFESANGLTNLEARGKAPLFEDNSPAVLKDMALSTARKISAGTPVDTQEAYLASQAASKLMRQAATKDPESVAALIGRDVGGAKNVIDDHLETVIPRYQAIRQGEFEGNAADDFNHLLPQNQNTSPNVLRGMASAAAFGASAKETPEHPILGPLGMIAAATTGSPLLQGWAIRAANNIGSAAAPAAGLALRAGGQSAADAAPASALPAALARILAARRASGGQ